MIGERLIFEFNHASVAGTPGLIGVAREHPARVQLQKLLPGLVATGSGIVIDSYGNMSNQADIVFYEKDLCPVYSINDAPDATYFPIECVISVGEVKINLTHKALFDALLKLRSSRMLRRYAPTQQSVLNCEDVVCFRRYGEIGFFEGSNSERFDQIRNSYDRVFTFIMCKSFDQKPDTILKHLHEFYIEYGAENTPNIIISLEDGFVQGVDLASMGLQTSIDQANAFMFVPDKARAFPQLVHNLRQHILGERTVPVSALNRYMVLSREPWPVGLWRKI